MHVVQYKIADDGGAEKAREGKDIGKSVDIFVNGEDGREAFGERRESGRRYGLAIARRLRTVGDAWKM